MTTPTAEELLNGGLTRDGCAQRLADALAEVSVKDEAIMAMLEGRAQDDKEFQALHQRAEAAEAQLARLVGAARAVYQVAQRSTVEFEHLRAVLDEIDTKEKP